MKEEVGGGTLLKARIEVGPDVWGAGGRGCLKFPRSDQPSAVVILFLDESSAPIYSFLFFRSQPFRYITTRLLLVSLFRFVAPNLKTSLVLGVDLILVAPSWPPSRNGSSELRPRCYESRTRLDSKFARRTKRRNYSKLRNRFLPLVRLLCRLERRNLL